MSVILAARTMNECSKVTCKSENCMCLERHKNEQQVETKLRNSIFRSSFSMLSNLSMLSIHSATFNRSSLSLDLCIFSISIESNHRNHLIFHFTDIDALFSDKTSFTHSTLNLLFLSFVKRDIC